MASRNSWEKLQPGSIVPLIGEFERRNIHQQDIATINQFVINWDDTEHLKYFAIGEPLLCK